MGARIADEVLLHAPRDLTGPELLILLVIGLRADDRTRIAFFPGGVEELNRRTRKSPATVRRCLLLLADRGLELRIPVGKDDNGEVLFAYRGVQSSYRVPHLRDAEKGAQK